MRELIEKGVWFTFEHEDQVYECCVDHYSFHGNMSNRTIDMVIIEISQTKCVKFLWFFNHRVKTFGYTYSSGIETVIWDDARLFFKPEDIKIRILYALEEARTKQKKEITNINAITNLK